MVTCAYILGFWGVVALAAARGLRVTRTREARALRMLLLLVGVWAVFTAGLLLVTFFC